MCPSAGDEVGPHCATANWWRHLSILGAQRAAWDAGELQTGLTLTWWVFIVFHQSSHYKMHQNVKHLRRSFLLFSPSCTLQPSYVLSNPSWSQPAIWSTRAPFPSVPIPTDLLLCPGTNVQQDRSVVPCTLSWNCLGAQEESFTFQVSILLTLTHAFPLAFQIRWTLIIFK